MGVLQFFLIHLFTFDGAGSLFCMRAFSICVQRGLLSSCSMYALHCSGFSCGGALDLGHAGSRTYM